MNRTKRIAVAAIVVAMLSSGASVEAAMFGTLEAPANHGSQISNVQGWVYTTNPGAELIQPFDVLLDGVKVMEVPCCSSRGDVRDQHPDAPLQTGFSGVLNWAREALDADGPVTVSVVVRDTSGDEIVLEQEADLFALASFPYSRRAYFDHDGRLDTSCRLANVVDPHGEQVAELSCRGLRAVSGDRSTDEPCEGEVRFTWDRASQGFKQTSFCEALSRWTDNGDGTATDNKTGLTWELKTGAVGEELPRECGLITGPVECSDLHDVQNAYRSATTGGSAPTGSVFSRFLTLLNRAVSEDGRSSTGCFAGHCDWRLPTFHELDVAFGSCSTEPCDEIPGASPYVYLAGSQSVAPGNGLTYDTVLGLHGTPSLDTYVPVRAVRGKAAFERGEPRPAGAVRGEATREDGVS